MVNIAEPLKVILPWKVDTYVEPGQMEKMLFQDLMRVDITIPTAVFYLPKISGLPSKVLHKDLILSSSIVTLFSSAPLFQKCAVLPSAQHFG